MLRVALQQQELFQIAPERIRPFLKWAGGKFRVLDRILSVLPDGTRLIEPFAGSAAVAVQSHRRFCGIEKEAGYVELSLCRLRKERND